MIDRTQRMEIARQVGMNILSISGGRWRPIDDGIELPVSNGYTVRVELTPMDYYKVSRVFKRAGKEWIKGSLDDVDCFQVAEAAYRASCFRSYDEKEWVAA